MSSRNKQGQVIETAFTSLFTGNSVEGMMTYLRYHRVLISIVENKIQHYFVRVKFSHEILLFYKTTYWQQRGGT